MKLPLFLILVAISFLIIDPNDQIEKQFYQNIKPKKMIEIVYSDKNSNKSYKKMGLNSFKDVKIVKWEFSTDLIIATYKNEKIFFNLTDFDIYNIYYYPVLLKKYSPITIVLLSPLFIFLVVSFFIRILGKNYKKSG